MEEFKAAVECEEAFEKVKEKYVAVDLIPLIQGLT